MGEIAEMMLDGTLCQTCGDFLGDDCGYPRMCPACEGCRAPPKAPVAKVACPTCGKKVKPAGLADHQRDVHRVLQSNSSFTAKE